MEAYVDTQRDFFADRPDHGDDDISVVPSSLPINSGTADIVNVLNLICKWKKYSFNLKPYLSRTN